MARRIIFLFTLLLLSTGFQLRGQSARMPYPAKQLFSPFEYSSRLIQELQARCDSLEALGITDSSLLVPMLELTQKYISFNPIQGLKTADKGIEISERQGLTGLASGFYTYKAGIFRYRGYRDLALAGFLKSYELRKLLPDPEHGIFGLIDIGNIYYDQRNFPSALRYYSSAKDSADRFGLPYAASVALNNMGIVYREMNMPDIAERLFVQSAELRRNSGFWGLDAHSMHYVASLCLRTGAYQKGVQLIQGVIDTMLKYDMPSELADVYSNQARLLAHLKQFKEARQALSNANDILLQHNMVDKLDYYYLSQAYVAGLAGDLQQANSYLNQLLALTDDFDNLQGKRRAYQMRYELYKNAGNYKAALEAMEAMQQIAYETDRQEVDRKLLEMEQANLLAQKEKELQAGRLQIEQQTKLLSVEKNRNQLLIALALLAIAALSVIGYLFLKQHQTNKALEASERVIRQNNLEIAARNKELLASQQQTEQLLHAKSEFLSQMSHEIRTPMNSIIGLTDLLLTEMKGSERVDKLQSIKYAADLLLAIINDILDLSAIEEGKIKLQRTPTPLHRLARELHNQLQHQATQKGIKLILDIDDQVPLAVYSDPTRLFQILLNLSSNAVKFTEKGEVHISIKLQQQQANQCEVLFEVRDTGIGIAADQLSTIFERFAQANPSIHRQFGGTGLGLTITQRLVHLLGGEQVQVVSTPGAGSTFSVLLTFDIAPWKEAASDTIPLKNSKLLNAAGNEIRLLYAEDNLMNQKVMTLLLRELGITPTIANHGAEALDILRKNQFDMVLMDFRMPVMDGFEATNNIRAGEAGEQHLHVPIIGVTADVFDESAQKARLAGMNDILQKPLVKTKLFELLGQFFPQSSTPAETSKA